MASNQMTPEQDVLTREFLQQVVFDRGLMTRAGVSGRTLQGACLELLNYVIIDGKYVDKALVKNRPFYGQLELDCEWEQDTRRSMEALDESNSSGEDEANSSEPSTDTEVREAVLREDV